MELEYANLEQKDLTGANFEASEVTHAVLTRSTLTDANLTGAVSQLRICVMKNNPNA